MESWRPILGFEGLYDVSDLGAIRNARTGKLKTATHNDGRLVCLLWKDNRQKCMKVHRAVLLAFVGAPPDGHECCHNNGNALDNRLANLRWDTPTNNHADKVAHGTTNRGERCGTAKLTESQVRAILADTRLHRVIAEQYGVRDGAISRIKSGKRWAHLQEP